MSRRTSIALLASVAAISQAFALDPSGTTIAVIPATAASGEVGDRVLEVQGPVYMGDEIKTDRDGQAQIEFVDNTRFVVGANSRVLIDSFVFDPDKTAQDVGIDAVKGTFRFITGASPKNAYAIRTPSMVIGVRGTAFDLAVRAGGESTILVHEGSTRLCDINDQCLDADQGSMVVAEPGGGLRGVVGFEQRQRIASFFGLLGAQAGLQPAFQVVTPFNGQPPGDTTVPSDLTDIPADFADRPSPDPPDPPSDPPDGRPP